MFKVKQRVRLLMKGCRCKSGCRTGRCGCKKSSTICSPGCRCTDCENTEVATEESQNIVIGWRVRERG